MAELIDRAKLLIALDGVEYLYAGTMHTPTVRKIRETIKNMPIEDTGLTPEEIAAIRAENERYKQWVDDLQSGMYVNCVYCGHRYGPGETTPVSMADALKKHIENCPKHPMSALKAEVERLRATYEAPPMPLTADDLARMEGKPVYVRYGDGKEGWDHVEDGMPIWLEADPDFLNLTCSFDKDGHFGLHVLGWQAFRRKPDVANAELGKDGVQ